MYSGLNPANTDSLVCKASETKYSTTSSQNLWSSIRLIITPLTLLMSYLAEIQMAKERHPRFTEAAAFVTGFVLCAVTSLL